MMTPLTNKHHTQLRMLDLMNRLTASGEIPVLLLGMRPEGKTEIHVCMDFPHEDLLALCEMMLDAIRQERYTCIFGGIEDSPGPRPVGEK